MKVVQKGGIVSLWWAAKHPGEFVGQVVPKRSFFPNKPIRNPDQLYVWVQCSRCSVQRWARRETSSIAKGSVSCYICSVCKVREKTAPSVALRTGDRRKTQTGYIVITLSEDDPLLLEMVKSGRTVSEHRYLMAKHLGRPLTRYESVHHKNGKRDDNRIENLELWVNAIRLKAQHSGQRLADVMVDYLDEFDRETVLEILRETKHADLASCS